jgi:hypothetical protein
LTVTNSQSYDQNNYDSDIIVSESLLKWHRMSKITPFLKDVLVQINTVEAADGLTLFDESKSLSYFNVMDLNSGPVEDGLKNAMIVIKFSASLDTKIDKRVVYTILGLISDVGGFSSIILLLAYLAI